MYVKAKNEFNHGGIISMNCGEHREVDDVLAKKLIDLGLVVEHKITHKKIKFKNESKHKTRNKDT